MPDRSDAADTAASAGVADGIARTLSDDPDYVLEAEFAYATEQRARLVAESIRVEVGEMPDERSGAAVDREGTVVSAGIGAADPVALRAGTNTWLRLVGVAEDVAAAADGRAARSRE